MAAATSAKSDQRLAIVFGRLIFAWLLIFLLLVPAAVLEVHFGISPTEDRFFLREDVPGMELCFATTLALAFAPRAWLARIAKRRIARPDLWVLALAALCLVLGVAGRWLIFDNYSLSLDEALADFDATIFSHGQILAPVAPAWRPYVGALQPLYMLPVPGQVAWASAYLPINAAMRALFGRAGAVWLVNPLLSAIAIVATYLVGRRLWPDRRRIAVIAAVFTGVSAQVLVMGMTAYAMPAHLAFNLVWLWLFLRGGRLGHLGALIVGFFATGIHQLAFHPLFAAPFVLQLWLDRRWLLAGLYTLAYAAIGLFWIEYWQLAVHVAGYAPQAAASVGGDWFAERISDVLSDAKPWNITEMAEQLVRFVTWQSPLLAPLLAAGAWGAFRAGGALRAMLLGIILTLVAMAILVPTQVNGWGYRYMHGLLGSAALIAAWTWDRLTGALPMRLKGAAAGALAVSCGVSLLVLVPLRAWQAWRYCHPYAVAEAALRRVDADVVIVDHGRARLGFDPNTLARNDPYLRNRPKMMSLYFLDAGQVRALCAEHSVVVFDGRDAARFGIDVLSTVPSPHNVALRALMSQLHCGQPMP